MVLSGESDCRAEFPRTRELSAQRVAFRSLSSISPRTFNGIESHNDHCPDAAQPS